MATVDLYFDVQRQVLISGLGLQTGNPNLPQFFQGDSPTFRIFLAVPTSNPLSPYTAISTAGLSLEVVIGQKIGGPSGGGGGTTYTQQVVWTADPTNTFFTATIPFNTAAINAALNGKAVIADGYFQVVYLQGGIQTTVFQQPCTINASDLAVGGVVVPPGFNACSLEYANSTFLTRTIIGNIVLKNPNTGKQVSLYLGDDNEFHADPIN